MVRFTQCGCWQHLTASIHDEHGVYEVMAANQDDGIGVIARWRKDPRPGYEWTVEVIDTESKVWELLTVFNEDELVPPAPPDYLLRPPF